MTDAQLLEELFRFMVQRNFIMGDEASVRDMVLRYKQPPLTLHHMVVMQMTKNDYDKLTDLLARIVEHFNPNVIPLDNTHDPDRDQPDRHISNLSPDITILT